MAMIFEYTPCFDSSKAIQNHRDLTWLSRFSCKTEVALHFTTLEKWQQALKHKGLFQIHLCVYPVFKQVCILFPFIILPVWSLPSRRALPLEGSIPLFKPFFFTPQTLHFKPFFSSRDPIYYYYFFFFFTCILKPNFLQFCLNFSFGHTNFSKNLFQRH